MQTFLLVTVWLLATSAIEVRTRRFADWQEWAAEHGCMTDANHYSTLLNNLHLFPAPLPELQALANVSQVMAILPHHYDFVFVQGDKPMRVWRQGKESKLWTEYWPSVIKQARRLLPTNFYFFQNWLDWPVSLHLNGSQECIAEYSNYSLVPPNELPEGQWVLKRVFALGRPYTLPLFSFCSHPCFHEIPVPHHEHRYDEREIRLIPWENKDATVYFRGISTGAHLSTPEDDVAVNRPRLLLKQWANSVSRTSNLPFKIDVELNSHMECGGPKVNDGPKCQHIHATYALGKSQTRMDAFKHKYVIIIDGHGWPDRFTYSFLGGSLLLVNTHFLSWLSPDWVQPFVHYVPFHLEPGNNNLTATLLWATRHDKEAREIAMRGVQVAERMLRKNHMVCFGALALLEYLEYGTEVNATFQ